MRSIDGDALRDEFKARCICECDSCKYQKGAYCGLIDLAPTVDSVPKGKWIITGRTNVYNGFEVLCSNCGTTLMVSKRRYKIGENYCDVCGAKMAKEGRSCD